MGYRNYQVEDFEAIKNNYQLGFSSQLVIQATGLGKTKMMAGISDIQSELGLFGKIFVLVNRVELVEQTRDEFAEANPSLKIGIEQANNRADKDCHVVIGSVQTLGTAQFDENGDPVHKPRLLQIDPSEYSVILVDETHRAPANTFRSVIMYFGAYPGRKNYRPWVMLLGFTATPNRMDNKGLEEFYSCVACNRNIVWGIENNWLTDIKAYRVSTSVNLDDHEIGKTKTVTGTDLSAKDLSKAINIPARNKLIIERVMELHEGRRGVFFCVDVQHAKDLCQMANDMGMTARYVFGETEKSDRSGALKAHKNDEFTALMNCSVLTEGYNDPGMSFVAMCRPTQSTTFYTQAIGRALRPFPAPEVLAYMRSQGEEPQWIKPYAILIDFCDLSSKHNLVTVGSIFGVGSKFDFKGKEVSKEAKKIKEEVCKLDEKIQASVEEHINDISSIEDLRSIVERINLLQPPTVSAEVAAISSLEWLKVAGKYEISLPSREVIRVTEDALGFTVHRSVNGNSQIVAQKNSLEAAIKYAEDKLIPDDGFDLLRAEAKWRAGRPSEKQINHLGNLRKDLKQKFGGNEVLFHEWVKKNYSKGQVSNLINEATIAREERKVRR